MSLEDCLSGSIDCALGIRDDLGLALHETYILKRVKGGSNEDAELQGFDDAIESVDTIETQILPSPRIVDYSQAFKALQGGNYKQGDIILKQISKNLFDRDTVELKRKDGEDENTERYYFINNELYTIVNISEKYFWFDIHLRKCDDNRTYIADGN